MNKEYEEFKQKLRTTTQNMDELLEQYKSMDRQGQSIIRGCLEGVCLPELEELVSRLKTFEERINKSTIIDQRKVYIDDNQNLNVVTEESRLNQITIENLTDVRKLKRVYSDYSIIKVMEFYIKNT